MTNSEICHKWVYNPELSWNNNSSNMSFGSRKLYSYNSVLAKNVNGVIHIDHRIANYSNSSQKQASHLRRAISPHIHTFEYDFSYDPLDWYLEQVMTLLDKQSRARKVDYTSQAAYYIKQALAYVNVCDYDKRKSSYRQLRKLYLNQDNMLAQVSGIIEASRKAKLKAKLAEDKRLQSQRQSKLDQFTGGGVTFDPNYNGVYLKVDGEHLRTTNHIRVNLAEAQLLYKRWSAGKPIIGAKLDCYTVVKSTSKSVTIGCTTIGAAELHRIFGNS